MSLVIMVGLSLLGLGFVAISETESAIAINERNAGHTQAIAEAGARAVVEWFQDPRWARNMSFLPTNNGVEVDAGGFKRERNVGSYTGFYKGTSGSVLLLDKPFRPQEDNRFYGDEDTADLEFKWSTASPTTPGTSILNNLNLALFGVNSSRSGRIVEIKIYAPPMIGAEKNADGFWEGGDRYGFATVKVTAEKWTGENNSGSLLSRRVVRLVVGEFPMPVPGGPVQSQSTIAFGGTADVHWGEVTSFGDLASSGASLPNASFPWMNPYNRPEFEKNIDPNAYGAPAANYLNEVLGKYFDDPWFGTRSRATNEICNDGTTNNCGAYTTAVEETEPQWASFENQDANEYPTKKLVTFPTITYDTWKKIATASRGMKGIYYFTYDSTDDCAQPPCFKKNGQGISESFGYWTNVRDQAKLGAGLYFFDTKNQQRPHPDCAIDVDDADCNLVPAVHFNSATLDDEYRMEGFVYLNAKMLDTSGTGSACDNALFNMPAEIFRDIGYRKVAVPVTTGAYEMNGTDEVWEGGLNGRWDYQDVNGNGRFDLVLNNCTSVATPNPPYDPTGPVSAPDASCRVVPWNPTASPACSPTTCSEPHEPYINFRYPEANTTFGINSTGGVIAKWEATPSRVPKNRTTALATCTGAAAAGYGNVADAQIDNCTSNRFDGPRKDNPYDMGAVHELAACVDGILFNEGKFEATGEIVVYGALLVRGTATGGGNVTIWFNEALLRGDPPKNMPRVMIYSMETDPNL